MDFIRLPGTNLNRWAKVSIIIGLIIVVFTGYALFTAATAEAQSRYGIRTIAGHNLFVWSGSDGRTDKAVMLIMEPSTVHLIGETPGNPAFGPIPAHIRVQVAWSRILEEYFQKEGIKPQNVTLQNFYCQGMVCGVNIFKNK